MTAGGFCIGARKSRSAGRGHRRFSLFPAHDDPEIAACIICMGAGRKRCEACTGQQLPRAHLNSPSRLPARYRDALGSQS